MSFLVNSVLEQDRLAAPSANQGRSNSVRRVRCGVVLKASRSSVARGERLQRKNVRGGRSGPAVPNSGSGVTDGRCRSFSTSVGAKAGASDGSAAAPQQEAHTLHFPVTLTGVLARALVASTRLSSSCEPECSFGDPESCALGSSCCGAWLVCTCGASSPPGRTPRSAGGLSDPGQAMPRLDDDPSRSNAWPRPPRPEEARPRPAGIRVQFGPAGSCESV